MPAAPLAGPMPMLQGIRGASASIPSQVGTTPATLPEPSAPSTFPYAIPTQRSVGTPAPNTLCVPGPRPAGVVVKPLEKSRPKAANAQSNVLLDNTDAFIDDISKSASRSGRGG